VCVGNVFTQSGALLNHTKEDTPQQFLSAGLKFWPDKEGHRMLPTESEPTFNGVREINGTGRVINLINGTCDQKELR
jgi:hypothetical protein